MIIHVVITTRISGTSQKTHTHARAHKNAILSVTPDFADSSIAIIGMEALVLPLQSVMFLIVVVVCNREN